MSVLKAIGKGIGWLLMTVVKTALAICKLLLLLFLLLCRIFMALVRIATP